MTTNIAWFSFITRNNTSADELRPCHLGLLYGSRDGIVSAIPFLVRFAFADDTSVLAEAGLVVLAVSETLHILGCHILRVSTVRCWPCTMAVTVTSATFARSAAGARNFAAGTYMKTYSHHNNLTIWIIVVMIGLFFRRMIWTSNSSVDDFFLELAQLNLVTFS